MKVSKYVEKLSDRVKILDTSIGYIVSADGRHSKPMDLRLARDYARILQGWIDRREGAA